ncbi:MULTISPECIES: hypothetical protein [unclassified Lysinibacillus]|uniref:transmembrane-type terpene cyclase n=1 Tax=unclassified Lysinibacillus TaxID=2636778 RepID=UPI002554C16D|nr:MULTISPECIES: hypothetical protein [unclassified Lysinibacillus]MDM5247402.1 hypothetical protein [Lysinibacillus sp. G4S2]
MTQEKILLICQLGMGLFWIITYILIIKQGFQDKKYGMPMAAICANISWEFIFAFMYPQNDLQRIITFLWFLLDIFIMMQFLRYGHKEYKKLIPRKIFYSSFFITLGVSFFIILAMMHEFNDIEGKYAAFIQNLMMSGLFIALFLQRGNLSGQSMGIAVCKMIGTMFAAVGFYMYFRTPLITIISVATLIYDWIYIVLIYRFHVKYAK